VPAVRSAGILLYRRHGSSLEVLLVHPGGPFWANKDDGAWSIPKGELDPGEEPLAAARREFAEELGLPAPADSHPLDLGEVKLKSGKLIRAFALEGELDPETIVPGTFELQWPPRSGRTIEVPEVDRAQWFDPAAAAAKLNPAQAAFVTRLSEALS
jgi:predicted NUDIX family NTP pyrophosphohydrolase